MPEPRPVSGDTHFALACDSLRELLDDQRRCCHRCGWQRWPTITGNCNCCWKKIEHGHIHIAVFGRVSVGKLALLNALLGETRFSTSPLHGETTHAAHARWQEYDAGGMCS